MRISIKVETMDGRQSIPLDDSKQKHLDANEIGDCSVIHLIVPTYKIPIQSFNGIPTNPKQTRMSSLLDCNLHVHNMYIPV